MSLNEREDRELAAIEAGLERDSMQLASCLRTMSPPPRRWPVRYIRAGLVAGLVMLVVLIAAAAQPGAGSPSDPDSHQPPHPYPPAGYSIGR